MKRIKIFIYEHVIYPLFKSEIDNDCNITFHEGLNEQFSQIDSYIDRRKHSAYGRQLSKSALAFIDDLYRYCL